MILHVLGCLGAYPTADGATSGYLLELPEGKVLMDCGAGNAQLLPALCAPEGLRAVVLSHLHYDHMSDLYVIGYYLRRLGVRLPVYVPGDTLHTPVAQSLREVAFDLFAIEGMGEIAGARLTTVPTRHPVPCRAMRFEAEGKALVYTGDTNVCAALTPFCVGADALLADAAFTREQWREECPHMSAEKAGELARAAGVKQLFITHFSPENVPSRLLYEARTAYPRARAASAGMTIVP